MKTRRFAALNRKNDLLCFGVVTKLKFYFASAVIVFSKPIAINHSNGGMDENFKSACFFIDRNYITLVWLLIIFPYYYYSIVKTACLS